jgi:hypothetical protein
MANARPRRWLVFVALAGAVLLGAGGVALGSGARRTPALSAHSISADASNSSQRVIVLLRNQHTNLPATAAKIRARANALTSAQAPLLSSVRASGGAVNHTYKTVNAFAATVSATERAALAANPSVAEVLPDAFVPAPTPRGPSEDHVSTVHAGRLGARARAADASQQVCPRNPSRPILAPEGLQLIHATQAQQIVTGAGVKVAFIAEGIDTNNPNFIRPNGQHVFVDYRDFTGQGLNAQTTGDEAFGDATTIAGQGTVVYDLSKEGNPANPLPKHCNITLLGVSPGAQLVAMKVFPTFGGVDFGAFNSTILQGMDWAVSQDHVNVLNESFGGASVPDTDQDVLKQFNAMAEAAGTTVTMSSGDQGTASTIGSPATITGPGGIAAGATTQFQGLAQTTRGAYQLFQRGWLNNNIAEFSSAGFTQNGATVDLVAPGNESFESCAPSTQYDLCLNLAGKPSNIGTFGGTSESAPMTAGVAALVIQAYRKTHGGASPTPELVKQLILSNANDLNIPSDEQGAGELDALAAVRAAESVNGGTRTGASRLVSPSQLDLVTNPGSSASGHVTVTNSGAHAETIDANLRTLDVALSDQHGDATLDTASDPTFLDYKGISQSYIEFKFHVPSGGDRLDGTIAWPGPTSYVNMTLFDPVGKMAAYTYQSAGQLADFAHISVRNPRSGTWTAVVFTPTTGGFSGAVHYDLATSRFGTVGSVTPSSVTLAPGASATLNVSTDAPASPGDYTRDLELSGTSGKTTVVPVVLRSLVPLNGGEGTFTGAITGGNGNGFPGQELNYQFNVPAGAPAVNVQWAMPNDPSTLVQGVLTSPSGDANGMQFASQDPSGAETMQLFQRDPQPGAWRLTLIVFNPVGGTVLSGPFSGTVSLTAPPVSSSGVPDSASTTVPSGGTAHATINVTNNGNAPMDAFADPRRTGNTLYSLIPISQASNVPLPFNPSTPPPTWLVPTETNTLLAAAQASAPILFEWGFGDPGEGDPDLQSFTQGTSPSGAYSAPEIAPGAWFLVPSLIGPFSGPASGTANTGIAAQTRTFDTTVSSSTGDPQLGDVEASPPASTPAVIDPGQTATIQVTFTASDPPGTVVRGDLFVDDGVAPSGNENEIRAIPYEYTVG